MASPLEDIQRGMRQPEEQTCHRGSRPWAKLRKPFFHTASEDELLLKRNCQEVEGHDRQDAFPGVRAQKEPSPDCQTRRKEQKTPPWPPEPPDLNRTDHQPGYGAPNCRHAKEQQCALPTELGEAHTDDSVEPQVCPDGEGEDEQHRPGAPGLKLDPNRQSHTLTPFGDQCRIALHDMDLFGSYRISLNVSFRISSVNLSRRIFRFCYTGGA